MLVSSLEAGAVVTVTTVRTPIVGVLLSQRSARAACSCSQELFGATSYGLAAIGARPYDVRPGRGLRTGDGSSVRDRQRRRLVAARRDVPLGVVVAVEADQPRVAARGQL